MGKVKAAFELGRLVGLDEVKRFFSIAIRDVIQEVNGRLQLGENVEMIFIDVIFSSTNTEVAVAHTLGRTPRGYLVSSLSDGAVIYDGVTQNTSDTLYLRSSVAPVTATVGVF